MEFRSKFLNIVARPEKFVWGAMQEHVEEVLLSPTRKLIAERFRVIERQKNIVHVNNDPADKQWNHRAE